MLGTKSWMAHSSVSPVSPLSPAEMSTNNPYTSSRQSSNTENRALNNIQRPVDDEKQVLSAEAQSGEDNAPTPVDSLQSSITPIREADKEVVSSWQSKSREDSLPIPMAYHESQPETGDLMNDVKGPPPAYDTLVGRQSNTSDGLVTTPSPIEPDNNSEAPPRPEDRSAVGQMLSWIPSAPKRSPRQMAPLVQPVIIPQLEVSPQGESVPFARCYSDVLAAHDVSIRDFMGFLDGLTLALAPNSALQGLKMFGVGVSHTPLPIIPLFGNAIKGLASIGSGQSSSRVKLYIERARKEYFEPRGLHLSVIEDNNLNTRLQVPSHAHRLAPLTKSTLTNSLCQRRLEAVTPYVAPLRYNVPEQDSQVKGVHKMARKHLDSKLKSDSRRLNRLREEQWQDLMMANSSQFAAWDERYANKMVELHKTQQDIVRIQNGAGVGGEKSVTLREALDALHQDQRDIQILVSERQVALQNVATGAGADAEMKEESWSRALKWIVIENLQ